MTNRDTLYRYLTDVGLKSLTIRGSHGYHMEFRLQPHQSFCQIITDWGYIMGVESIHLFANEVMVEPKHSDMEINIKYKFIDKFKVEVFD